MRLATCARMQCAGIRPDVARFLVPGTDPADVFPALQRKYSPSRPASRRAVAARAGSGRMGAADVQLPRLTIRPATTIDSRVRTSPHLAAPRFWALWRGQPLACWKPSATENFLHDLLGNKSGAVAVTTIDDKDIFGSNSTSATYTDADAKAAQDMRDNLMAKYPDIINSDNKGFTPSNALFHAETNVLLRAAESNGGTLEGKSLEIYIDRDMCANCRSIVPLVGLELGNPAFTFVDPKTITTIYDGLIISRRKR